ncbi:probable 4-coumarate--CoA ligase 1 [Lucilia cuprina]|uniref:probable 4-coumarate--CoA ligase 1 n=1 Tax=Lucilia cuprina TaxID=7375 RepID=UPI001F06EAC5|nr:probable 4-coumarate--CoA ligase 1 [Lucilia cuprina]
MVLTNQTTYDKVNKIWCGKKTQSRFGPESSVGSVIYESLQKDPDHIAQICYPSDKKYTNKDILTLSIRVAQHLERLKLKQTEVIGICAGNSDFLAPLVFGCMFRGLTISTLDPSFDKDGIKHIYSITKPKIMFCDGSAYQKVKESFAECGLTSKIVTVRDHIEGVPSLDRFLNETGNENYFKCVELEDGYDQTAVIICSSGTTGLPKGVCESHASILNTLKLPPSGSILSFSSIYWISGIFALITGTIENMTRVISYQSYNAEDALEMIKRYNIELFLGPPNQLALMLASPKFDKDYLASVKLYFMLGSPLPFQLVGKLKSYIPDASIYVGYGMSETCGGIAGGIAISKRNCGQLFDNIEIKIIDENGRHEGELVVGEICARTQYKWSGYYGNPQATSEIYDSERWVHTGDLGYVDNGCVFVVDRKKDILKYNNFHFFPNEIENVIMGLPDVVEVCVCGIPDVVTNNLPAAAVVKTANSTLTEEQVYKHVTVLAHYKHLRGGVYFVEQLPKTISGKVLRRKVTELCTELYRAKNPSAENDF